MIYCIEGTNPLRVREEIDRIHAQKGGDVERIDGSMLTENQLPDLLSGGTLFSESRFIIIRGLSENTGVWERLGEWIERIDPATTLVVVESKFDKRTKTYKALKAHGEIISISQWTEKDRGLAEEWLRQYARKANISLSPEQVRDMVDRAYMPTERPGGFEIDQLRLLTALRSLSVLEEVTDDAISTVMPPAFTESVYDLMEAAIRQKSERAKQSFQELKASEDGYKVFALLVAQWTQLVSLAMVEMSDSSQAASLGIHPYIVKKMTGLAQLFNHQQLREITVLCADLDSRLKLSEVDPWDCVWRLVAAIERKGAQ